MGHLRWLFAGAEKPEGCFAANYWATGKAISDPGWCKSLSRKSLSDTPFQVIKLFEFTRHTDADDSDWAKGLLKEEMIRSWITTLKDADKRGVSAFPRPETQQYRLEDHVWIWKALVAIEKLGLGKCLSRKGHYRARSGKAVGPKTDDHAQKQQSASEAPPDADFSSDHIRSNVLKRFTTENTVSRRRMIAVARTNLDTRFSFHSRDTALFYDSNVPFLSEAVPLWKSTIEAQKFHEENDDDGWGNPLRYALALMMGSGGHQINSRLPREMLAEVKAILLGTGSSNGLIPGQLDDVTKEPELFGERWRDFYWHVSFEVPYILWTHNKILVLPAIQDSQPPRRASFPSTLSDVVLPSILRAEEKIAEHNTHTSLNVQAEEAQPTTKVRIARKNTLTHTNLPEESPKETFDMKKSMPFNVHIDQKSIVQLPDEWLYSYPDIFGFDPKFPNDVLKEINDSHPEIETGSSVIEDTDSGRERHTHQPESPSVHSTRSTQSDDHPQPMLRRSSTKAVSEQVTAGVKSRDLPNRQLRGLVVDVPKTAQTKGHKAGPKPRFPEKEAKAGSTGEIYKALKRTRKAEYAKKRFIWLPNVDPLTEKIYISASSESESDDVKSFFERHDNNEIYFLDDATAALNIWRTELHLSFFQLFDQSGDELMRVREERAWTPRGRGGSARKGLSFLGGKRRIERATMGFLFIGDFLDRHWTCHFLERDPVEHSKELNIFEDNKGNGEKLSAKFRELIRPERLLPTTDLERRPWRQRKALELLLLDRMLQEISDRYHEMLGAISNHLAEQLPRQKKKHPRRHAQ